MRCVSAVAGVGHAAADDDDDTADAAADDVCGQALTKPTANTSERVARVFFTGPFESWRWW